MEILLLLLSPLTRYNPSCRTGGGFEKNNPGGTAVNEEEKKTDLHQQKKKKNTDLNQQKKKTKTYLNQQKKKKNMDFNQLKKMATTTNNSTFSKGLYSHYFEFVTEMD